MSGKKINNRIKLVFIFLIFILIASWNIGNYMVDQKYSKLTGINDEIEKTKELAGNNTELVEQLTIIDERVKFMNAVCFK